MLDLRYWWENFLPNGSWHNCIESSVLTLHITTLCCSLSFHVDNNNTIWKLQWWYACRVLLFLKKDINGTSEFSLHVFTFVTLSSKIFQKFFFLWQIIYSYARLKFTTHYSYFHLAYLRYIYKFNVLLDKVNELLA